jgi:hypothetical protein
MPRDNSGDDAHSMGEGKVLRETEKAILVSLEGAGEKWIPKSVVHDDSEIWKKDDTGKLVVKMWWAEKNVLNDA